MKFGAGNSACGGAFLIVLLLGGVPYAVAVWVVGLLAENWNEWARTLLWMVTFVLTFFVWGAVVLWIDNRTSKK